jgi:VWFA-related protein
LGLITVFAALCGLAGTAPVGAQEDDHIFHARARLVEITLQAVDERGRHVTDLRADELRLEVGGRQRDIRVFQPVQVALERFGSTQRYGIGYRDLAAGELARAPQRHYLLLFHQVQFAFGSFQRARQAAIDFVSRRMLPGDRVSIVCFDKVVDYELDFTSDREAVLAALVAMQLKHRNIKMNDEFYLYLQNLAHRLAEMPGKVNIILIAEGMKGIGGAGTFQVYDRTINLLQAADVRIFGIDAGGLNLKDPGATIARYGRAIDALVNQSFNLGLYSAPTGGRYFRYHNDIAALFDQVDYEMSAWYVVGFYADEREDLDEPLAIRLSTQRPGVRLFHKQRFMPAVQAGHAS